MITCTTGFFSKVISFSLANADGHNRSSAIHYAEGRKNIRVSATSRVDNAGSFRRDLINQDTGLSSVLSSG